MIGLVIWATLCSTQPVQQYKPGEVLVRLRSEGNRGTVMKMLHASEKARLLIGDHHVEHWLVSDTMQAVQALKQRTDVLYAEPNYTSEWLEQPHALPNDPLLPKYQWMWHSPTTVCSMVSDMGASWCAICPQPAEADIDADLAWDAGWVGSKAIIVADQEGEPDYTSPDIAQSMYTNAGEIPSNGIDDDHNGKVDDVHGWDFYRGVPAATTGYSPSSHSTLVWGTMGGNGNNGYGGVGVNWYLSIVPALTNGVATYAEVYAYLKALGVRGVNMSFGSPTFSQTFHDAICNSGLLFVASAGNNSIDLDSPTSTPQYPAKYDCANLITVGASSCQNKFWPTSNYNYGLTSVDLVAPGLTVYSDNGPLPPGACLPPGRVASGCATSCVGCDAPCTNDDDPYYHKCNPLILTSGTSFSAPTVLGVAALMWSVQPGLSPLQVKDIILSTVDKYPTYAGYFVTGGKVNAYKAVAKALQTVCWNAPTCDCNGAPVSSLTYEVQREVCGNPPCMANWQVMAETSALCFTDVEVPQAGMAYLYRVFAKSPDGTVCCDGLPA